MPANKDYLQMTREELLIEEKKIKKRDAFSAALIGFLIGVMVYGIAKDGFGIIYIGIPAFLIFGIYKNTQNLKLKLKEVQKAIQAKTN